MPTQRLQMSARFQRDASEHLLRTMDLSKEPPADLLALCANYVLGCMVFEEVGPDEMTGAYRLLTHHDEDWVA